MSGRDEGVRPFPVRPTLTLVFMCAMGFWAACALAYATGDVRGRQLSAIGFAVSFATFLAGLALAAPKRVRVAGCVLAAVSVGAMLGCAESLSVHALAGEWSEVAGEDAVLTLLEDSSDNGFGEMALVEARMPGRSPIVANARLATEGALLCGQRARAVVSFVPADYSKSPSAWQQGSSGQLKAEGLDVIAAPFPLESLIGIRSRAIDAIGSADEQHALLQALVCGYRRNVENTRTYAEFQACGLAHLVAVSGAHLVIVTGLVASLLKRLGASRRLSIVVLISTMAAYYVIAGMPVSALRAAIMSSLGLASFFGQRRPSSLNAIGIGLFAIVGTAPSSSVSASLVLSGLSTTGIVLFGPLALAWLERTPLRRLKMVREALALTFSASLLSQLYACSLFSQLPLVSPLANVVCAPLFPLVCSSGLIAGAAGLIVSADVVVGVSSALSSIMTGAVGLLSHLPYASIPFAIDSGVALAITAVCSVALWAVWPRFTARFFISALTATAFLACAFLFARDDSDRIVMLDVGQGDSILVESRGASLLVDTGNRDTRLLEQLAFNHVAHIDSVLITHADDDHCGSLDAIAKAVDVDRVIVAQDMLACDDASAQQLRAQAGLAARETIGVRRGDTFNVGAFAVRVVWPRSFTDEGGNADSLCVVVDYDADGDGESDVRALMTGDAEAVQLKEMISAGDIGDIDILKVGHHGSRNAATAEELEALAPEIALISCGANNRYGHPAPETLTLLEDAGARTFRTDRDGEIRCTLSPEGISVRCFA